MNRLRRRAMVLGTGACLATGLLATALTGASVSAWPGGGPVGVTDALSFLLTAAAAALTWWVTLALADAARSLRAAAHHLAAAPGAAPAPHVSARLRHRVVAVLLTVAAGTVPTGAASATPPTAAVATLPAPSPALVGATAGTGSPDPVTSPALVGSPATALEDVPEPGWTPTPPAPAPERTPAGEISLVSPAARGEATAGHRSPEQETRVVVRAGDTLWAIAARHLGPEATDQDVAEAWPRWYAANRHLIGDDPDLILPGQELRVPGAMS